MAVKKKVAKKTATKKTSTKTTRNGRGRGAAGTDGLTDTARLAIQYYIADPRMTQYDAYMKAFKVDKATALGVASRLFNTPEAKAYLEELREAIRAEFQVELNDIVREYASIAFSDMGEHAKWSTDKVLLEDSGNLTELQRKAISEVTIRETAYGTNVSIKLHDKKGALHDLARIMGYMQDKVKVEPGDKLMEFLATLPPTVGPPSERGKQS
jgi:phage terminase small subunit